MSRPDLKTILAALLPLVAAGSTACATLDPGPPLLKLDPLDRAATGAGGPVRLVRTPSTPGDPETPVTINEAADLLADADVVFLGELHDSAEAHAVQLALTKAIAARSAGIVLSMEMFERDAQARLDLYLAGAVDEPHFLAGTRPWPNYRAHYRGAVEFAREAGYPVLAANCYRPIASKVVREGLASAVGNPWAARHFDVSDGEYRRRFDDVMALGAHTDRSLGDKIFAAQVVKDETMAESIADALQASTGGQRPTVVHWCGAFHSDFGLGTVERLKARMPDLNIAVVSTVRSVDVRRALIGEEADQGHFVVIVPPVRDE